MKCPVCPDANLVMSERQGIEIDYCPNCRGVWLDRGELDKIIERATPQDTPVVPTQQQTFHQPPQQQYGHYSNRDHYKKQSHGHGYGHGQHYKKKKSFFEELFD